MKAYKNKIEQLKKEISSIENDIRITVYDIINDVASEHESNIDWDEDITKK